MGSTINFNGAPNAGWIITQWTKDGILLIDLSKILLVSKCVSDSRIWLTGIFNLEDLTTKADLSIFTKVMAGKVKLRGKALLVADMNQDGSISAADLSKLTKLLSTSK